MPDILLAIGSYNDWDIGPMQEEYSLHTLGSAEEIPRLPEALRQEVRAIAFKFHGRLTGELLDALPNLGLVSNYGVGYDAIDVDACKERGIRVTNTPDVLNDDVADLAVAMLVVQSRQMIAASAHVRSGAWAGGPLPLNRKVSGRRAGIVGLGRIGRDIADRLAPMKMEIHYTSRSEKETPGWTFHPDIVSLATAVDYLFVALVGGPETAGAIDRDVLAALGPDGIVINISRGSVVDEDALIAALQDGTIRGAGLDVFASEPDLDPRFLDLDNVVLQPHQGSATIETRRAMGQLQRDNIAAFFAGDALLTPVV